MEEKEEEMAQEDAKQEYEIREKIVNSVGKGGKGKAGKSRGKAGNNAVSVRK